MENVIPERAGFTRDQVASLVNCRGLAQYRSMMDDYLAGKCPFCDPLSEKNVVLHETPGGWRIWRNPFPIKHTKHHLIMAPRQHRCLATEFTAHDFTQIGILWEFARDTVGIKGGGVAARIGPADLSAGTVLHQHCNAIEPDGTGDVQVTLGKSVAKLREAVRRMWIYDKIYRGEYSVETLPDYERQLIADRT